MGIDEPSTAPLGGSPQTVPGNKWIRGVLGGQTVVDSRSYLNVWEIPYWRWWFFRREDINGELTETAHADADRELPDGAVALDLVCDEIVRNVAWTYVLPRPESTPIAGHICFYDEIVDTDIDGHRQPLPQSHFT